MSKTHKMWFTGTSNTVGHVQWYQSSIQACHHENNMEVLELNSKAMYINVKW